MNISNDGKWKWSWWLRRCQLKTPIEERGHAYHLPPQQQNSGIVYHQQYKSHCYEAQDKLTSRQWASQLLSIPVAIFPLVSLQLTIPFAPCSFLVKLFQTLFSSVILFQSALGKHSLDSFSKSRKTSELNHGILCQSELQWIRGFGSIAP